MDEQNRTVTAKELKNPGTMSVLYGVAKLAFAMMTLCELYYFSAYLTDVAMFATTLVAVILSVTGVIDFIISLFLGVIFELIPLPWGKYRSWLLLAPPLVTATHILMFVKIGSGETVSAAVIIIGFVLSHVFWSLGESAHNTMPLVMTDNLKQRANLSVWGGRGSMGNSLVFGIIATPIVNAINGAAGNNLWGYCVLGLILCAVYWVFFWLLFFATKGCEEEAGKSKVKQKSNLGTAVKGAITNPHLLATILCVACTYCYMILQSSTMYYYFSYTLGAGSMIAFMGTFVSLNSVARLGGSVLVPFYLKLFGGNKRKVYLSGFIAVAVCSLLAYILPLPPVGTIVVILIGHFLGAGILAMQLGLYMDCAVYSEYKTGKDVKGFVMTLTVLPVKLGITVKNFIVSAALVSIGYSATATDTSSYAASFNSIFLLIPAVVCALAVVVHLIGYHLNEEKVAQMQSEIETRKAAAS